MRNMLAGALLISALVIVVLPGCSSNEKQTQGQNSTSKDDHIPLSEQLATLKQNLTGDMPPEILEIGQRHRAELLASGMLDKALNVGDKAPSFTLQDALGKTVSSSDLLAKGPIVVAFYRGGW